MQNYECKVCGAELKWEPTVGALLCEYCENQYQPSDFEDNTLTDNPSEVKSAELDTDYVSSEVTEGMVVYACKECGAEVVASKKTMATECIYCGMAVSITNKAVGDFRPEQVVPFALDKKKAQDLFKAYTKKSWLSPKSFSEEHTVEKMQGVYVPFHLHDMNMSGSATVEVENRTSSRSGDDKVTTHKVYEVAVKGYNQYENIPTDAAKDLDNNLMDALEPFKFDKLDDFNPAYMAGYLAEQADEEKEDSFKRAEDRAEKDFRQSILDSVTGYDSKSIKDFKRTIGNKKSKYAMLPVWILNVRYKGNLYKYAINGETGKVTGKLPISGLKTAIVTVGPFLAAQVLMYLFW